MMASATLSTGVILMILSRSERPLNPR